MMEQQQDNSHPAPAPASNPAPNQGQEAVRAPATTTPPTPAATPTPAPAPAPETTLQADGAPQIAPADNAIEISMQEQSYASSGTLQRQSHIKTETIIKHDDNFRPLKFRNIDEDKTVIGIHENDKDFREFAMADFASDETNHFEGEDKNSQEQKIEDMFFEEPQTPEETKIEEPAPPVISEEFLKSLHESAYAQGFQEGKKLAAIDAERNLNAALAQARAEIVTHSEDDLLVKIVKVIQSGLEDMRNAERDRDVYMLMLMLEILRKILPGVVKKYGTIEIEHFFQEIMKTINQSSMLEITLPKYEGIDFVGKVKYMLREKFSSDEEMEKYITIKEGKNLDLSDCEVAWKNGSAERNYDVIWADIERILTRHMWLGLPEDELHELGDEAQSEIQSETQSDAQIETQDERPNVVIGALAEAETAPNEPHSPADEQADKAALDENLTNPQDNPTIEEMRPPS